jgi:cytochrome c556
MKRLFLAIAVASLAATSYAHAGSNELIKFRQSGYAFMEWNMHKIQAQVIDHPESFDRAQVVASANVIAAIANSGLGALFAPGTDTGTGWQPTRVKQELFLQTDKVKTLAMDFNHQANQLAVVAVNGDPKAIRAQLGKVAESCKNCHERYRARE